MITAFQFFVAYLIVDVLCAVLAIIIASSVSRDSGSETQVRFFNLVLSAFLVFVIFDAVWAFLSYGGLVQPNEMMLGIVNGINLSAIAFDAYFWFCFTLARFNSKLTDRRSWRFALAIPAIAVPVIHVVGFFAGQNVIALSGGRMAYGICHTIIVCIQLLYIVAATIYALRRHARATTRSDRRLSLVFVSFMLPFIIGGVVDTLIAGTPVAAASIAVSLTFVMMSMLKLRVSNDALTGLNNRRRADEYLEERLSRVSPERPLHLFIMDLDDFKAINDRYGHLEGDRALQLMAEALRVVSAQLNAFAARWGGDEFVFIVARADAGLDLEQIVALIGDALASELNNEQVEYSLTCSVGYASCDSADTDGSRLLSQADQMLYQRKRARAKGR